MTPAPGLRVRHVALGLLVAPGRLIRTVGESTLAFDDHNAPARLASGERGYSMHRCSPGVDRSPSQIVDPRPAVVGRDPSMIRGLVERYRAATAIDAEQRATG